MKDYLDIVEHLKTAPESQLDPLGVEMIKKWSNPPTPLEVMELLDYCACFAWCSESLMYALRVIFTLRCNETGVTDEELDAQATWRPLV